MFTYSTSDTFRLKLILHYLATTHHENGLKQAAYWSEKNGDLSGSFRVLVIERTSTMKDINYQSSDAQDEY